jgi:DnaK suppressor protein
VKAPAKKTKTPAKPAAKPAVKTKTVPKPIAKASAKAKVAAKPVAKKAVKAPPAKPVAAKKPVARTPVGKTAQKATAAKAAPAKSVKVAAKPVARAPAQPVKNSKPAAPVKAAPKVVEQKKPVAPAPAPAPAPRSSLLPAPAPLKPGRRSSARIPSQSPPPAPMVPTHAPDAAKASYSTMTERVIAPPPHVAAKKDPKLANNWKTKPGNELSDDEVKAMPDSEYMNDKQMAFFRHKLSVLKQEIHNSAGETTEHLREDTVVVPDPADRATIEEEHALELRTRDRERKLLKKIEQSIARIDSGDYGYCDETGEPIGVGRLIARPTANLSLEAQQRRELKQKMFGD